jgi:hypothetical protein
MILEQKLQDLIATNPSQVHTWTPETSGKCHYMNVDNEFEVNFFASYESKKYTSSDPILPSFYESKSYVDIDTITAIDDDSTPLDVTKLDLGKIEDFIYKNLFS